MNNNNALNNNMTPHNTHNTFTFTRATAACVCTYIGRGAGCSAAVMRGKSYCTEHYYQVYKAGSAVQRRKDEAQAARVRAVEQLLHEAIEELTAEGYDVHSSEHLQDLTHGISNFRV